MRFGSRGARTGRLDITRLSADQIGLDKLRHLLSQLRGVMPGFAQQLLQVGVDRTAGLDGGLQSVQAAIDITDLSCRAGIG